MTMTMLKMLLMKMMMTIMSAVMSAMRVMMMQFEVLDHMSGWVTV